MGKKGRLSLSTFLQSHVAISANFARIDKNLVPIDLGKSILFVYQHLLAAYPYIPFVFFTKSTLSTIWTSTGNRCANAGFLLAWASRVK